MPTQGYGNLKICKKLYRYNSDISRPKRLSSFAVIGCKRKSQVSLFEITSPRSLCLCTRSNFSGLEKQSWSRGIFFRITLVLEGFNWMLFTWLQRMGFVRTYWGRPQSIVDEIGLKISVWVTKGKQGKRAAFHNMPFDDDTLLKCFQYDFISSVTCRSWKENWSNYVKSMNISVIPLQLTTHFNQYSPHLNAFYNIFIHS